MISPALWIFPGLQIFDRYFRFLPDGFALVFMLVSDFVGLPGQAGPLFRCKRLA